MFPQISQLVQQQTLAPLQQVGNNFAAGTSALSKNTTGTNNTAIGPLVLYLIIQQDYNNTAIGNSSLLCNTSGSCNTAIGTSAFTL
jgi:trimeric autotransporter adhesin